MKSSAELDWLEGEADGYIVEAGKAASDPTRTPDGDRAAVPVASMYFLMAIDRRLAQIAGLLGRADE